MAKKSSRREFIHAAGLATTGMMAAQPLIAAAPQARPAQPSPSAKTMGAKFRELLNGGKPFENMGVYDVFTARMIEMMGFASLWLSSAGMSESHGVPDWSLISDTERLNWAANIAQRVNIPAMVDIDEGGITPLTLYRSVKNYERAGIGAIHLTDELNPGGQNKTMPLNEMLDRIHAALDARSDLVVTARSGGWTRDGKQQAIDRGTAYVEAGAESVWFLGAPLEECPNLARAIKVPLTAQFFNDTPFPKAAELKVTLTVFTSFVTNIAHSAAYEALTEFKNTGMWIKSAQGQRLGQSIPAEVVAKLQDTPEFTERAKKYHLRP
jgi:methylisocitrate lyase